MIKSIEHYKSTQIERDLVFKSASKNVMELPKLDKISLSLSQKEALVNNNKLLTPLLLINLISGQKPLVTKSKKSIAQFKLREGKAIGCKVNLRNNNLYIFLEKLLYTILPQIIETRTNKLKVNKTSMNIGIEDISIFTELENQYDLLKNTQGLTISLDLINKTKNAQIPFYFFSSLKIPIIFKYTK
jgi:large subunit ribosomal protein L5